MTTEEVCSRMHCVDKVRTLLEECLGPPNETAFLNFDRCLENELALSVEEQPDQTISFQSFLDRVSTFRPQYWGADPNAILQFAKYGWRCTEKFTIKCDVCLSTVECSSLIQKPELWTLVSHKGHEKLCFWMGCPCPDRFTKITINPKILKKKMALYVKRTSEMGSDLPSISQDVLASMNITNETLGALFEILGSRQTDETVSALVLAICGWLNSEVDRTMKCGYCQRQILFHNFVSIKDKCEEKSVSGTVVSVSSEPSSIPETMEVCDDRAVTAVNSPGSSRQNVVASDSGDCNKEVGGAANNPNQGEVISANLPVVSDSDSTVLQNSDAASSIGEDLRNSVNASVGNDSESKTVLVSGKEAPLLETVSNDKPLLKMETENEHVGPKIAEESGRLLNGGMSEDGEVGHEIVTNLQSSKKRRLEDDEDTEDAEKPCTEDQQNVKKMCLQNSLAVEKNGECGGDEEEVVGQKVAKKDSTSLFNNCHGSANERGAVCKTGTDQANVNSEQLTKTQTAVDGKLGGYGKDGAVVDVGDKLPNSDTPPVSNLLSSDNNSVSAAEGTGAGSDTASTKLNGDAAPAFVSDSIHVPKLNSLMDVGETASVKDCSSVAENDASKELSELVNSKPDVDVKVSASESPGVAGSVSLAAATSDSDVGKPSATQEGESNGPVNNDELSAVKSNTAGRTLDCEMKDSNLSDGAEGSVPAGDSKMAESEPCEMETEPEPGNDDASKRSGKRKLEDCAEEGDNIQSKKNKTAAASAAPPKKQFHPVEEHRYWCIWKLRTKDRGVQKEGWRQVLDYLKLSPPTPAEEPTPDFYGEVKKLFTLLGDW